MVTLVVVAFLLEASYSPLALSSKGENPVTVAPSACLDFCRGFEVSFGGSALLLGAWLTRGGGLAT